MKIGFDNELYVKLQSEEIKKKMELFPHKLYLEFGGKLFDDYHAERVLPGFQLDAKIRLLQELKEQAEIILCINANDIEKNKVRTDYGITYDTEVLRLIHHLQDLGMTINSVVITLYKGQEAAKKFEKKLLQKGIKTYIHEPTKGYPTDVDTIVSDEGYGANPYIETTKPLVVVTAPGAGSGKLATCLSQLYHEYKMGLQSGYAKFETFPVWNLPLKHPLNMAYEAATADINDRNMVDYFHLEKYGIQAINYNRDLEVFPVLKTILQKITGKEVYASPTDMGVNTIQKCIIDDEVVKDASKAEIIRRYYQAKVDYKLGTATEEPINRIKLLMNELEIEETDRIEIVKATETAKEKQKPVIALSLPNGKIVTGKETDLLMPSATVILNALKELTHIPDEVDLISSSVLDPILKIKKKTFSFENNRLGLEEVLIALSICSVTNPIVSKCLKKLDTLSKCEAHSTYIVANSDTKIYKKLKIHLTCDPTFYAEKIYE